MSTMNELTRRDASYILDWLRAAKAPTNIVLLQRRVVIRLGGYVSAEERRSLDVTPGGLVTFDREPT